MSSKYLIINFYDGDLSVSVHNSYEDVKAELIKLSYDDCQASEILIGDTWYDENNYDYVKVQRIDV